MATHPSDPPAESSSLADAPDTSAPGKQDAYFKIKRSWLVCLLVIVGILWAAGTFDRALVGAGLNTRECAQNGFGATFCGEELDEYRQNVVEPLQDVQRDLDAAQREVDACLDSYDYSAC